MAELNLAEQVRASTAWAYGNLVNDLNALEEDKATGSLDSGARPAIKLVAECGAVNKIIAGLLTTGEMSRSSPEQQEAYYAGITTRAEALTALDLGTQELYAAIDGIAADRWGEIVETFFGPRTLLATANIASMHMMYHDGQLNSLHLRHGDTEMHWKQP